MSESIVCSVCKKRKEKKDFSVHDDKVKESVCCCKEVSVCDACFGKHLANGGRTCLSCEEDVIPKNYRSGEYISYEDKSAMTPFLVGWMFCVFDLLEKVWNAVRDIIRKADVNPDILRQLNAEEVLKKDE